MDRLCTTHHMNIYKKFKTAKKTQATNHMTETLTAEETVRLRS